MISFSGHLKKMIKEIYDSLHEPILENGFFYLDGWSFIHVFSGFVLLYGLGKIRLEINKKYFIFFGLFILWEIFEMNAPFIESEKNIDVVYDFVYEMFGGVLAWKKLS